MPSRSGRPRSSVTRSGAVATTRSRPAWPDAAVDTSKPCMVRLWVMSSRMSSSSSTTTAVRAEPIMSGFLQNAWVWPVSSGYWAVRESRGRGHPSPQLLDQGGRVGGRQLADHPPADVGRRLAVHERAVGEQRDSRCVRLSVDDDESGTGGASGRLREIAGSRTRPDDRDLERTGDERLGDGERPPSEARLTDGQAEACGRGART